MTGHTMMIVGAAMAGGALVMEILLSIIFRATKKRMIKKIYEESDYR